MRTICITSILLLLATAINALIAGYVFISDPSGSALNTNITILKFSPFSNFLIPGIILFTVIGIFSLAAFLILIFRFERLYNFVMLQGAFISGWITLQIIFLRSFNFLHILFLAVGILLFVFGRKINLSTRLIMLDPSKQFDL